MSDSFAVLRSQIPTALLEGTGKFMRHVKLRPESDIDAAALTKLVRAAYTDIKSRVQADSIA
jgi:hypothetical protein